MILIAAAQQLFSFSKNFYSDAPPSQIRLSRLQLRYQGRGTSGCGRSVISAARFLTSAHGICIDIVVRGAQDLTVRRAGSVRPLASRPNTQGKRDQVTRAPACVRMVNFNFKRTKRRTQFNFHSNTHNKISHFRGSLTVTILIVIKI